MNFYLQKYGFQGPHISVIPESDLGIIIVIPCFNEVDLIDSLSSIYTCEKTTNSVEVIVVINASEVADNALKHRNEMTYHEALQWINTHQKNGLSFHLIFQNELPKKHAGVGLARKIGMDEAVYRFDQLNRDGIIVCFDADSKCDPNYLVEIERHFSIHPKSTGCSIFYEHPLAGSEFEQEIYDGIIRYELHLRYYNQALVYAKLPFAFHTVGSSMAVRSSAYQKQGGMNKRKAGEDFYFIHKIIELGGFTELKSTRIIPSPRVSDRVPFGTGKAIGDWILTDKKQYFTYNFHSFKVLQTFVKQIPAFEFRDFSHVAFDLENDQKSVLFGFLDAIHADRALTEIRKNASNSAAFKKRFFRWFDAFMVLKFMHYFRDHGFDNQPIENEVHQLFCELDFGAIPQNALHQLEFLRKLEKK